MKSTDRKISLERLLEAARLEEEFQAEIWGVVEGGHDMDRLNLAVNVSSAYLYLGLYVDANRLKSLDQKWKEYCGSMILI